MLDQLLNLVQQFSGNAVVNNPEIPNEKNNEVVAEATHTIAGGLQNMLSGGGLQSIISLFNSGNGGSAGGSTGSSGISGLMKNPIVTMMIGHFISKLTGKFGMNSSSASNVANDIIPNALNGLISKTNDPNDKSFDFNSLIGALTGGGASSSSAASSGVASGGGGFNLNSLIGKVVSDKDGDGDTDIQDIIKSITGGAQKQQQTQGQGGGGGLMDTLKGLIGGL